MTDAPATTPPAEDATPAVTPAAPLDAQLATVVRGLQAGTLVPYLGASVALLEPLNAGLPINSAALIERFGKKVPIPGRLRKSLTAAAQYIETFRHRKVLRTLMCEAFAHPAVPSALHHWLASLKPALIVDMGYDAATASALAAAEPPIDSWGQVQGISRAESRAGQGQLWVAAYTSAGEPCAESEAAGWQTLLYKPIGSVIPAGNFLVSDADFVEVLTEIDVQTPIPAEVQTRRTPRGFVFLGCRFDNQLARTYARQIAKRSAGPHCALIGADEAPLTRNEKQFVEEYGITVIPASVEGLLRVVGRAGSIN